MPIGQKGFPLIQPTEPSAAVPLTQISMRSGKSSAYRRAVMGRLHQAMVETFDAPEDGAFVTLMEYAEDQMGFGKSYLGIERSDDLLIVQITANNTRTVEQKKSLYKKKLSSS